MISNVSLPRLAPSRTATIGITNAMYERNVACISFRSHCHATNVTTEPAIARYRIAPRPWGHVGTAHGSRAMRETPAKAAAPTAMDAALKLIGSVSWPHRFTATVANAAHVAPSPIDNIGNTSSRPPVPSWLRSRRTIDATANRKDADKNGGAPSRPIRIASQVEPQMRQSMANAALRVELVAIGAGIAAVS